MEEIFSQLLLKAGILEEVILPADKYQIFVSAKQMIMEFFSRISGFMYFGILQE